MSDPNNPDTSADDSESIYRAPTSDTSFTPEGDMLATYVGPKNAAYYAKHFERFKSQQSAVSWNWPAFFVTAVWLLYRKMWLYAFGYWIVLPIVFAIVALVIGLGGNP